MDTPPRPHTQHPSRTLSRNTFICLLITLSLLFAAGLEVLSPAQTSMHKLFNKLGGKQGQSEGQGQQQGQEGWQGGQAPPQVSSGVVSDAQQIVGKVMVAYFINWGIYGRKYFPSMIPFEHLTHINYAFANVLPASGEVVLTDTWSDVEIHYEGDSWNEEGTNLYGNFKAIYLLKKRNRNLKVLISIGGWSYRENFKNLVHAGHRQTFVSSALKLVEDVGLDGLDIDWEYPANHEEARAFVELLRACREGLDGLAERKGKPRGQYQLTIAAPCGAEWMEKLLVKEMDPYLNFWNLMAYDFAGSWDKVSGHNAPLYGQPSADRAVQFYHSHGVPRHKLVLGLPVYGRAFQETDGIGRPFNGVGEGSFGGGVYDYKDLPRKGVQVTEDLQSGTAYTYDSSSRELVSYDTPAVASAKAQYIVQSGLGGAMFWDLSMDHRQGEGREHEMMVPLVGRQLGQLQWRENELDYRESKYENLRRHMDT